MLKTPAPIRKGDSLNLQQLISDQATCTDLLKCAFSLSDVEVEIYKYLIDAGPQRADRLAEDMGRNPSSVYRSLQKMVSCGIVIKETKNLDTGGAFNLYRAKSRSQLKDELKGCMDAMMRKVDELLDDFEEGF